MRIKNLPSIESMDGSQDALVIEQTDGSEDKSRKVSPAQIKQYVLGNSIDDVYSVMGEMGAKNLLVPEWVETKTTENGVTYTFNADGTIIMNTNASGATADTNCNLRNKDVTTNNVFPAGSYTFTGCPTGGASNKYRAWLRAYRPNTNIALTTNLYEEGNGVSFTVSEPFTLGINATVRSGYVCNNLTWKPMLRLASDTDNTYQPYAKTNRQLTEAIGDLSQTGLTGDSVAAQLTTAKNQIANKIKKLPTQTTRYNFTAANTYQYTGANVTCPAGHTYIVRAWLVYSNSEPKGIVASSSSDTMRMYECYAREELATSITFMLMGDESAYIWGKGTTTYGDDVKLEIIDITN